MLGSFERDGLKARMDVTAQQVYVMSVRCRRGDLRQLLVPGRGLAVHTIAEHRYKL